MTNIDDETLARWRAEAETRSALFKEALAFNKAALFQVLERAGVHLVNVRFDGAGDSGQIESIDAYDAGNAAVPLPDEPIEFRFLADDLSGLLSKTLPVAEIIEAMAYGLLGEEVAGWENNDGAYGEFRFDAAAGAIALDYFERYMSEEHSLYAF